MTNSEVELVTSLPDMVVKLTVTAEERQKYEIEAQLARMVEEEDIMSPLKGNHSHYRAGNPRTFLYFGPVRPGIHGGF